MKRFTSVPLIWYYFGSLKNYFVCIYDDNYFDFLLGLRLPVFLKYEPDGPGGWGDQELKFLCSRSFSLDPPSV
jgi:hypothetical protein